MFQPSSLPGRGGEGLWVNQTILWGGKLKEKKRNKRQEGYYNREMTSIKENHGKIEAVNRAEGSNGNKHILKGRGKG
jgi:hypothetical protein